MFKDIQFNYALFGNPVNYSKSPKIHSFFSKQTNILHNYKSINVLFNDFHTILYNFFEQGGKGANITAPFKEIAYSFCNHVTERASIAQSVNTLKKINNKYILGDNTDGIGLLCDLVRLKFIKKNSSILIIGAGGASKGILFPLLSFGCSIFILNRTMSNAEKLVFQFQNYGKIDILQQDTRNIKYFDLIINATSKYNFTDNFIPFSMFSKNTCFYDINYKKNNTFFIDWCTKLGFKFISNGIGMLVFQAAHSFFLWHNILPKTDYIIDMLNGLKF